MLGIVDYGLGNLLSVVHAVEAAGYEVLVCTTGDQLKSCDRIILPGVGAFRDCISNLQSRELRLALDEFALTLRRPVLGICLGMQAMAKTGWEGGECAGLGWLDAEVSRLSPQRFSCRVPHIGWNSVDFTGDHAIWSGIPRNADFYFVHSYQMVCRDAANVLATTNHGGLFTAAVAHENIVAVQFHPEKSQEHGLTLIHNFASWCP
jgi:glutamine amidotransferase